MIKEFKHETIVITKEGFFFMKNEDRKRSNVAPLTQEQLEKWWSRMRYRNGGASSVTHPINENEVRIDQDSFCFRIERVKEMLTTNGFTFRQDGFVQEGCYM